MKLNKEEAAFLFNTVGISVPPMTARLILRFLIYGADTDA